MDKTCLKNFEKSFRGLHTKRKLPFLYDLDNVFNAFSVFSELKLVLSVLLVLLVQLVL
jgi:hypothetical protein